MEFPVSCGEPATTDGVLAEQSGCESPAAMESDEEILIVEREEVHEGSPETAPNADRSSPATMFVVHQSGI